MTKNRKAEDIESMENEEIEGGRSIDETGCYSEAGTGGSDESIGEGGNRAGGAYVAGDRPETGAGEAGGRPEAGAGGAGESGGHSGAGGASETGGRPGVGGAGEAGDRPDAGAESGAEAGAEAEVEAGVDGAESAESADTKYLRLAADFQNYKRRVEKERFERYGEGKKDFAADLLPILDNFDRALAQDAEKPESEREQEREGSFVEGMAMILKQFQDALAKNNVYEIEALGADFDPNVHHAVSMEPSDKYESQKVSEVLLKGYRIGDKVIRPSMVKVAE